jgi:hypothetical protein
LAGVLLRGGERRNCVTHAEDAEYAEERGTPAFHDRAAPRESAKADFV